MNEELLGWKEFFCWNFYGFLSSFPCLHVGQICVELRPVDLRIEKQGGYTDILVG